LAFFESAAIEKIRGVLETFPLRYEQHHLAGARAKLGRVAAEPDDAALFGDLLGRIAEGGADRRSKPVVIPRKHRVKESLAAVGDLGPFDRFVAVLREPFAETPARRPSG
jgi:uncharacterized protein YdiU (UPF0061 family)